MSVTFSWSAPIESPKGATVVVREALLPMLLWPSVPVVREVEQRFTVIDRFVLEAASLMAPVTDADIAEVTGVPRDAIAGRLAGLGLLVPEGIGFAPTESRPRRWPAATGLGWQGENSTVVRESLIRMLLDRRIEAGDRSWPHTRSTGSRAARRR